jgi:protein-S-isoprenylcysteine O-methyltransferase Ste14
MTNSTSPSSKPSRQTNPVLNILLSIAFGYLWFFVLGEPGWWQGWLFLGCAVLYLTLLVIRLHRLNPDLFKERGQLAENVPAWDRRIINLSLAFMLGLAVVAALDSSRYHWSHPPLWLQILGWIPLLAAFAIIWHVMSVNSYLSSYARLQPERGQTVVQQGLYARIRHPMYLGVILAYLGIPFLLGSLWACIPAVLLILLYIIRTALEDQMLLNGLEGYPEYAQEVPFRILPKIW